MSYADWDTITGTNLAILNSSLSSPLPGSAGSFCRQLGADNGHASLMVTAAVSGGAFVGIPITKAVRAEGYLRRGNNVSVWGGGFFVKWSSTSVPGYGIVYDASPQAAYLVLNNGSFLTLNHSGNIMTTWLSFRMDVFPLSTTGDQIVVSQETSPGSGVFNPISINGGVAADGYFVSSALPTYAPWGGTRRCGLSSVVARGGAGSTLLDMVRFSVSTAP
jgi:hypothetical protein